MVLRYSPQRLASELSVREFVKLCDKVDGLFGKKVEVATSRVDSFMKFAEYRQRVRFNVLEILRGTNTTAFRIDLGKGRVENIILEIEEREAA